VRTLNCPLFLDFSFSISTLIAENLSKQDSPEGQVPTAMLFIDLPIPVLSKIDHLSFRK
jgi:hypothetical protein